MRHAVIVLVAVSCLSVFARTQTAEELVNKNIQAKGGLEKIKAIKSLRMTGKLSAGGGFTAGPGTASPSSHGISIRSCAAGSSTTGRSTAPRCIPSCNASTPTWCAGSARSTSGCGPSRRPSRAGNASPASTPGSSPTGHGSPPPGDQDDKSRMTGDRHVRIRGSPGMRFPRATRPVEESSQAGSGMRGQLHRQSP